jgi:hypothetical protein
MKKKTLSEFIEQSKKKFGDLFDYSIAKYDGLHKPITLICSKNHIFETLPITHLSAKSKGGCIECHLNNLHKIHTKYDQLTFIEACNKVHNNKYTYEKTIYKSLLDYITIVCKIHGEFVQKATVHLLNKCGCPHCGKIKSEQTRMLTKEEIDLKITKFKKKHNNKYTYGKTFRENNILWLELICSRHGSHITRLFNHEKGHGCPKCVSVRSNIQIQWLEYRMIRDGFIQHSDNKGEYIIPGTKLSVDGFNEKTNTIYEFQGDFWHGNPTIYDLNTINKKVNTTFQELYDKTIHKINTLQNMGYNVVYIWENDWRKGINSIKKLQKLWRKIK